MFVLTAPEGLAEDGQDANGSPGADISGATPDANSNNHIRGFG